MVSTRARFRGTCFGWSAFTLGLQAPAAPEEVVATVTVKSTRPTEVKTSEIGSIVTPVTIETIPQVTRNFLEFADTIPGMAFTVDNKGNTSLVGGAQNESGINVFIDGVGQKNYVKEGGVSGNFASQGNPFPQLAIGEYKVITSNYKAEFDQITSAAVTADTSSMLYSVAPADLMTAIRSPTCSSSRPRRHYRNTTSSSTCRSVRARDFGNGARPVADDSGREMGACDADSPK